MASQEDGVVLLIGRETRVFAALGVMVRAPDGEIYAERIVSSDPKEMPLPTRLRLDPKHLEVIQEPDEAGRPKVYRHRMILAVL
jgi:hypothetical protein